MRRAVFLANALTLAAAACGAPWRALAGSASFGKNQRLTETELFDEPVTAMPGDWVRYDLGFGVQYSKQIGFGRERVEEDGRDLLWTELQNGLPGGTCNPNLLKKAYLRDSRLRELTYQYPVLAYVAKAGPTLSRWGDHEDGGGKAAPLLLLDSTELYDRGPYRVVSVEPETILIGTMLSQGQATTGSQEIKAVRVSCLADGGRLRAGRIETIDVWRSARVPLGIAAMKARVLGKEPFSLRVAGHGWGSYTPELKMPLASIRTLTQSL